MIPVAVQLILGVFGALAAVPAAADGEGWGGRAAPRPNSAPTDAALTTSLGNGAALVRIDGVITHGLERRFDAAMEALPQGIPLTIELSSPGGFTGPGYRLIDRILAERIAGRSVATRVRSGESCESMCVGIYLAGFPRYAHPSAEFMVHAPRIHDSGRITLRSTQTMVDRLKSLGASARWLDRVKATGGFSGTVDHRETAFELAAENANVVTNLLD